MFYRRAYRYPSQVADMLTSVGFLFCDHDLNHAWIAMTERFLTGKPTSDHITEMILALSRDSRNENPAEHFEILQSRFCRGKKEVTILAQAFKIYFIHMLCTVRAKKSRRGIRHTCYCTKIKYLWEHLHLCRLFHLVADYNAPGPISIGFECFLLKTLVWKQKEVSCWSIINDGWL